MLDTAPTYHQIGKMLCSQGLSLHEAMKVPYPLMQLLYAQAEYEQDQAELVRQTDRLLALQPGNKEDQREIENRIDSLRKRGEQLEKEFYQDYPDGKP